MAFRRLASPSGLWKELNFYYRKGLFLDLDLICRNGSIVACHALVLASVSKVFYSAVKGHEGHGEGLIVYVPDLDGGEMKAFLTAVYSLLAGKEKKADFRCFSNVIEVLQVIGNNRGVNKYLSTLAPVIKTSFQNQRLKVFSNKMEFLTHKIFQFFLSMP